MASIGSLVADLKLESAAFIRDLGKAAAAVNANSSAMRKSMASIESAASSATKALGAYVTIAAAKQVLGLAVNAINSAAALKDQSAAVGISTKALQAWRIAGDQAGVSAEELDNSIGMFVRNLGQARAGTGPLVEGLKTTNGELLRQVQYAGSNSEALDIMIRAIEGTKSAADRARLGAAGFGRGWQSAVKLASDGAAEAKQRFIDLGLVLDRQTIEKADAIQDSFSLMREAINVGFQQGVIDSFNSSLGSSDEQLKQLRDTGEKLGRILGSALTDFTAALDHIQKFTETGSLRDLYGSLFDTSQIEIRKGSVLDFLKTALTDSKFSALMQSIGNANVADARVGQGGIGQGRGTIVGQGVLPGMELAKGALPEAPKAPPLPALSHDDAIFKAPDPEIINASTDAIISNAAALEGWTTKTVDALGRSMEFQDLQKEGEQLFASLQTPTEQYASTIERLGVLLQNGAIDADTYARAHQAATLTIASTWLGAAGAVSGALTTIFKDNKAVAIANAVINTAEAITAALKNPPGPPFSYVYAAAAAAAGAAQIATIASTNPGSGKTAAFKSPGTTKATADAGGSSRDATVPQQSVTLVIEGDSFGPEHFKKMVAGLNGVIADGAVLRVAQ